MTTQTSERPQAPSSPAYPTHDTHIDGKAPVVVLAYADLSAVAVCLREAPFEGPGQECGVGRRVLVHESVAAELTDLLFEQVSSLVVGEPKDGAAVGLMISQDQFERVLSYLEQAQADGVRAVVGGGAIDRAGFFVAPTMPAGAACAREEIFGPVITVETFTDVDEAICRANDLPYGLSASAWTNDARRSHAVVARLDSGTAWVNCHLVLANEVPWGGFTGSRYGRDLSLYTLDDYSRTKHVMHHVSS